MAVGITDEPLTYTRDRKGVSYFRDCIDATTATAQRRNAWHDITGNYRSN